MYTIKWTEQTIYEQYCTYNNRLCSVYYVCVLFPINLFNVFGSMKLYLISLINNSEYTPGTNQSFIHYNGSIRLLMLSF